MDNTTDISDKLYSVGKTCQQSGMDFPTIQEHLRGQCNDEALVTEVVTKLKKEYNAERTKEGQKWLIAGLGLLMSGFVLAVVNYHSNQSIAFAMYGLTSAGLIILFYGMYKIIG